MSAQMIGATECPSSAGTDTDRMKGYRRYSAQLSSNPGRVYALGQTILSRVGEAIQIETIEPVHKANLAGVIGDLEPICYSVSTEDEALILLAEKHDVDVLYGFDEQPGSATFGHSEGTRQYDGTLIVHDGLSHRFATVRGVSVASPRVQVFPDGEILVVGTRCWLRADGSPESNALGYSSDGQLNRTFVLGDGIKNLLISDDGSIWASYFDEGIYGNSGWGSLRPGSQYVRPIGASGLVRFDKRGRKLWEFSAPTGHPAMDDCYALNVDHDTTWAYYYAEFALARIDSRGQVQVWDTGISGARALAVHGDRVLLFGGYGPDESRVVLVNLTEHSIKYLREFRLSSPLDGRGFHDGLTAVGRGPVVHLFADRQWYQIDLRKLP